jgi:hypothetical protein
MTSTLHQLVSDLRSDKPRQRSVDIASVFLMSTSCYYKGHSSGGVVNPFVPVSKIDDCSINYLQNLIFQVLEVGKNFTNAPMHLTNERILLFSYFDGTHDITVANSVIQTPNEQGLFLPSGRVDFEYISYWLVKGYVHFQVCEYTDNSDTKGWSDNIPLDNGLIYSGHGFTYLTQPTTLADYLEGIDEVDGGFGGVDGVLKHIAEQYDNFFK